MNMTLPPGPLKLKQIRKIWILGAGFFGRRALDAVHKHLAVDLGAVIVVDNDPRRLKGLKAQVVSDEAIAWLRVNLPEREDGQWGEGHLIIPTLPIHVAAEWLKAKLGAQPDLAHLPIPGTLLAAVPNPYPFPQGGGLYTSIATWRCPDDCPAPVSHCPHTGKPRDPDLYTVLGRLQLPGTRTIVIHSRQVAPGVGGFTARQLWDAYEAARLAQGKLLTATICRCHGVIDYFAPRH